MTTKTKPTAATAFPMGIVAKDLVYPDYGKGERTAKIEGIEYPHFTLYEVKDRHDATWWAIATLHISNPGSRARRAGHVTARTYAVRCDDKSIVTVGVGPHVVRTVEVYVKVGREAALKPLTDLYLKGLEDASMIRDRISTRRANTIARRSVNPALGWFR